jgi:hypothetical protein
LVALDALLVESDRRSRHRGEQEDDPRHGRGRLTNWRGALANPRAIRPRLVGGRARIVPMPEARFQSVQVDFQDIDLIEHTNR